MSIVDFVSDPLGRRYKKQSWGQRLGITALKKKVNKAVLGPFRALSPSRKWHNFKQRVKKKLGYNSEFARAYRSGEWGKYMKRKLTSSEIVGPFYLSESQYDAYGDFTPPKHDAHQTGPTNKGIFRRLSKYAAPGIVLGLATALGTSRLKLLNKVPESTVQRFVGGVKRGVQTAAHHVKDVGRTAYAGIKPIVHDAWSHFVTSAQKQGKKHVNQFFNFGKKTAKKFRAKGKTASERIFRSSEAPQMIMPFRESYDRYQQREQPGLISKMAGMAIMAGGAGLALKGGHLMLNPTILARRTALAGEHLTHLNRIRPHAEAFERPALAVQHGLASAKHTALSALSSVQSMFVGAPTLHKMRRAAAGVRAKAITGGLKGIPSRVEGLGDAISNGGLHRHNAEYWTQQALLHGKRDATKSAAEITRFARGELRSRRGALHSGMRKNRPIYTHPTLGATRPYETHAEYLTRRGISATHHRNEMRLSRLQAERYRKAAKAKHK